MPPTPRALWRNFPLVLRPPRLLVIRDIDAGHYAELFMVAAVNAILVIRFYLFLTGYPQLGAGKLHIAHMLWGGLLLTFAALTMVSTLNRQVRPLAAVFGGIGFGTFIDELGKFITKDNDYFYRPTIALLYVIFVILFLILRAVQKQKALTEEEYIINALGMMQDMALGDFDEEEKNRAAGFLRLCRPDNPTVVYLQALLAQLSTVPTPLPTPYQRARLWLRDRYVWLLDQTWFNKAVVLFFVFQGLSTVLVIAATTAALWTAWGQPVNLAHIDRPTADLGSFIASIASGLFIIRGVLLMPHSRLKAYQDFRRAMLISVFITQFFSFYAQQLRAIVGLFFNVAVLLTIHYMLAREYSLRDAANAAASTPG